MQQGQRVKGKGKGKIEKIKAAKKQARFGDESTTYRNGVKRGKTGRGEVYSDSG